MIVLGENSFVTNAEFYDFLDLRLNADVFNYRTAVDEASGFIGVGQPLVIKALNDMRGATYAAIKAALIDNGELFDETTLQSLFDLLEAQGTNAQKTNSKALILATQLIDQLEFIGVPTIDTQPLQWPRLCAVDRNGLSIPDNNIPKNIKAAVCELALFLLRNDITNPSEYLHAFLLTSETVGESKDSYSKRVNKKLPDYVMDLLKPFLLEKSCFSSAIIF